MPLCPSCGATASETARFCMECGASVAGAAPPNPSPAAPPTPAAAASPPITPPPATARPTGLRLAGLPRRFFAFVLDSVLVVAGLAPLFYFAVGRWGTLNEYGPDLQSAPILRYVIAAGAIAIYLAYFTLFGCTLGSTPAKIALNHRVRSRAGTRAGFGAALVRSVLLPVDLLIGFPVAVANRLRQRAGDLVAGTIVVRHTYPGAVRLIFLIGGLVAVIAGFWVSRSVYSGFFQSAFPQG
jgi:uncharacterized RDD family membrane protein YckC